jgi:tRNA G10  N-methylase Trm11
MPTFFFHLGNTPQLSLKELKAVFPDQQPVLILPEIAQLELPESTDIIEVMDILGGVVKISELLKTLPLGDPRDLKAALVDLLSSSESKPTFGIAEIGRDHLEPIDPAEIKKELEAYGLKARYLEGSRLGLSASILLHRTKVIELNAIQTGDHIYITQTQAVQNIDAWSFRDRAKPYADRRKGMLPPKVARMMVNLAVGDREKWAKPPIIYDPFCGTGTILTEALLRDCRILGSDLDLQSAEGTRSNIDWLLSNLEEDRQQVEAIAQPLVFAQDVTRVQPQQLRTSVDAVVTEPFLGKPTPQDSQLPNIFKGLSKLYWGAFKQWTTLLADGGKVVIVFPYVQTDKQIYSLESLIDKIAPLGYTMESEPVLYHRPQAVIQRQIHTFSFKKN